MKKPKQVWTIGHSNRSIQTFIDLLKEHGVEVVVDVRRLPASKTEHFKTELMEQWLPEHGVGYVWLGEELGGYRRGGYRSHMHTKLFREGIRRLMEVSKQKSACAMCMEANPRYCHRRFISQYLEKKGVKVSHILKKGQKPLTELM